MLKIYSRDTNRKAIEKVVDLLEGGGVIIYPTDTVYAFGCSIKSVKGINKLKAIRSDKDGSMSIVCANLKTVSAYAKLSNEAFKVLKRNLPGPFTFILEASGGVPDKFLERRKTVGVKIPDNAVALAIVEALGHPLITTSVREEGEAVEYTTDPELIEEKFGAMVDLVIDGGYGHDEASTVVDCTGYEMKIIRQGAGELKL